MDRDRYCSSEPSNDTLESQRELITVKRKLNKHLWIAQQVQKI